MMKLLKLAWQIVKSDSSLYISIILLVLVTLPIASLSQGIRTDLAISLIIPVSLLVINFVSKLVRFSRLEGEYFEYEYDVSEREKLNTKTHIGVYNLEYEGGYKISLKKTKNLKEGKKNHLWEGTAEIADVETGLLCWQYISPPKYLDFVGYKRVIISENKGSSIRIYMLPEGSIYTPRSVLIKKSKSQK